MKAPSTSRDQLIADERAAERAVIEAESALRLAEAIGTPDEIAAARTAIDVCRTASLATRATMQAGLDAWGRYAAYQEAVAHAEANGVTLPTQGDR
jgi:hypothetical protein